MSVMKYGKHLSLNDHIIIEQEIYKGSSRSDIARLLSKDKSTICKEVKLRSFHKTNLYDSNKKGIPDGAFMEDCGVKFCNHPCDKYDKKHGVRREIHVG